MTRRISFLVHGQVQGVSFRYFTRKKATSYGLTGWVRNTAHEQVEGEAQGPESAIEDLIQDLNKGPSAARVAKLDHSNIDPIEGDRGFEIR